MNGVHPGPGGDRSNSDTNQEFRMLLACNFSTSEATGFEYHLSKLDPKPAQGFRAAHWAPIPVQKPYDQEQDEESDDPYDELLDLADFAKGVGERLEDIVDEIRSIGDDDEYDGDFDSGAFG